MDLKSFVAQVDAITRAIVESYETNPLKKAPQPPQDFAGLLTSVRSVAEKLILEDDVNKAISRLRQDQEALLNVVTLTTEMISFEDHKLAVRRAHEATIDEPTILPFYAYCSYLIELCNGLELAPKAPGNG